MSALLRRWFWVRVPVNPLAVFWLRYPWKKLIEPLEARLDEYDSNPEAGSSWEEAKARIVAGLHGK
jgi:hypothetical protein